MYLLQGLSQWVKEFLDSKFLGQIIFPLVIYGKRYKVSIFHLEKRKLFQLFSPDIFFKTAASQYKLLIKLAKVKLPIVESFAR